MCLHALACVYVGVLLCYVHVCSKWKVNSEAVGCYLPPFLSLPATLTVQSLDNGGETNSASSMLYVCEVTFCANLHL